MYNVYIIFFSPVNYPSQHWPDAYSISFKDCVEWWRCIFDAEENKGPS